MYSDIVEHNTTKPHNNYVETEILKEILTLTNILSTQVI